MIRNYFKIAWRNQLKNRTFSLINIAGLAIGLGCFILIALYVVDEISYDRYNEKADRIYRINTDIRFGGTDLRLAVSSDPMAPMLKQDYSEVEQYTRFYNSDGAKFIRKDNEFISEPRVVYADSTVFDVFTLPSLYGNTRTALDEPNSVVISESAATKYFGYTNVVGKTIETRDAGGTIYNVTAVIKDVPANSHFNFDFFFSMKNVNYDWGNFLSNNFHSYVVLKPGVDYKKFAATFGEQVMEKYIMPQARQYMHVSSPEEFRKSGNKMEYTLMPLTSIHLHSDRFPELGVNGNIQYVYIFSAVALFILLIACVNFMNLSTARSANRAKEVGIRKVLGTGKKSLIGQFLVESTLVAYIALIVAIGLVALSLGYFNSISNKELQLFSVLEGKWLFFLLALPLVVGLLAGSYPAFFLSSFKPIAVLKGKINKGFKKNYLRSGLVVFQFFTSIVLIVGTIVIFRQLNYIQDRKLGFNKDQVLIINGTNGLGNAFNRETFRNVISKMDGVKQSSFAGYLPVDNSSRSDNSFFKEAAINSQSGFNMQIWNVDYDYINVLGMEMAKGRDFSREFGTDSTGIILNESAAKVLGYEDPIGKKIYTLGDGQSVISYTVLGVVKNFNYQSLRQEIGPLAMRLGTNNWATAFKVSTTNIQGLLAGIENKWKSMAGGIPFSYEFLDQSFDSMYRTEQRIGRVALSFAVLAIFIACLGLFGLATYMAELRTREIGVRKVLGASVTGIVSMLSRDFIRLVLVAAIIAFPVAWFAMDKWLQDFAYRVNIGWVVFLIAGLLAIAIAVITVSLQAIRAALANPVKSLRTE